MVAIFLLFAALLQGGVDPKLAEVERAVLQAQRQAGGTLGLSMLHVESGGKYAINGDVRFPMQSVYKLPIAIEVLSLVDSGQIRLSDVVHLGPEDQRPGFSPLAQQIEQHRDKVKLTIGELLEAVLVDSDNTASDALLRIAGSPAAVTARIRSLGIKDMTVNRPEGEIFLDYHGVRSGGRNAIQSLDSYLRLSDTVGSAERRTAARRYSTDTRHTSTRNAMVQLLLRVHRRDFLSEPNADRLIAFMSRCQRGTARIKGLLPTDVPVAHRPGTGGDNGGVNACTNDVGIVTLRNGAGHLVIAIFLKGSHRSLAVREDAIAHIARGAYEAWSH